MTRTLALLLIAILAAVLATVAIPVFVIMPFKDQSPTGVALAYWLRRWSPLLTLAGLAGAAALVAMLWRRTRRWQRALAVLALAPLGAAAWFARQNHFEWMFAPLAEPGRVTAAQATFVAPSDMVMGVVLGGQAMAYPVNQLAYHHVVNDTVGGGPIAATY